MMNLFQEVYDRIRYATNARTQLELAEVIEIRQSSISDAKRRDSVPSDWYMKLFEKFGLNPDWLKKGVGPMYLRTEQGYAPADPPAGGVSEDPAHYGDPAAKGVLVTVHAMHCPYEEGARRPEFRPVGKVALPQTFAAPQIQVFRADSDAFSPTVRRGAYVGIDTEFVHPVSGEMYAVLMPHEGLALKRLFFDAARDLFLLRTDHPDHPDGVLSVKECPQRLVGRLVWVLQQI